MVSDGAGRIIVATGNGVSPPPGPGSSPPSTLAESVVRLAVNGNGTLTAKDFFSPVNNTNLDREDADLGSGGPLAIPDGYATSAHPHLLVEIGKDGRLFLLDRDNLGGVGQGAGGSDAALQTLGPYNGVWGHPAFWGGDGGYVYVITNGGPLTAFKVGVAGNGLPSLSKVGASTSTWGYTSGSPVVTSTGTTSGSSLVWAEYSSGSNGSGGELRAYDTVPSNGVLALRYSVPIGTASKFAVPATENGRVYVGNRTGVLYGFGRPTTAALSGRPTDFGAVTVNTTASQTVTVTATRKTTVSAVGVSAPFSVGDVSLPATLDSGQQLQVPVNFTPTTTGAVSGALTFTTDSGNVAFDVHGSGAQPGLSGTPSTLDFGQVPTGGTVTQDVTVTNTGSSTTTINSATGPSAPFSAGSLPVAGSTLAAGASVAVPVSFAPTGTGSFSSSLVVDSSTGSVTIPISGVGVSGAPHLTVSPTTVDFGSVPIGKTVKKAFSISNTGNLVLTLTKAAPPAAPFGTPTPVSEGQQIDPGDVIYQTVTFTPTAAGAVTGSYLITGNDGQGAQTVVVKGVGTRPASGVIPTPAQGGWTANGTAQIGATTTTLTPAASNKAGSIVYPAQVYTNGLHARFTAQLNGGSGADGLTFALLDPASSSATSLGGTGGALGFAPASGVAVALDTFRNPKEPSANFFGIATGAQTGPVSYVATRAAPTALRSGTHVVDVTVSSTGISVSLDGSTPLTATLSIPPRAFLAFTGSTGGKTDVHAVSGIAITSPAPTGAITGIGGKCVDVQGGLKTNGTPIQLSTCNGSTEQLWTLPGDQTLQALGKCLDVPGSSTVSGTKVQLYTCNSTWAQTWVATATGGLMNPHSNLCLDATGASSADGTLLQIATCTGAANQTWRLPGAVTTTAQPAVTHR